MEFESDTARAVVPHLDHLSFAASELLNHAAEKSFRAVDDEQLDGLLQPSIDSFGQDLGLTHHELIALTPHRFDEDRQLQLASPHDAERFRAAGLFNANRDICQQL